MFCTSTLNIAARANNANPGRKSRRCPTLSARKPDATAPTAVASTNGRRRAKEASCETPNSSVPKRVMKGVAAPAPSQYTPIANTYQARGR
jgi:hypothetical protein